MSVRRRTRSKPAPARSAAKPRKIAGRRSTVLRARDLMTRTPVTVREDFKIGALCDLLQERNINGVPVVDAEGRLVGVVTQEDIIYGAMGHPDVEGDGQAAGTVPRRADAPAARKGGRPTQRVVAILRGRHLEVAPPAQPRQGERPFWAEQRAPDPMELPVRSIMTSPAISAEEGTLVSELCRIMWSLKIHRVPIQKRGKVTGLVSSMDLCRAILEGKIRI